VGRGCLLAPRPVRRLSQVVSPLCLVSWTVWNICSEVIFDFVRTLVLRYIEVYTREMFISIQ
jgi:hypothetical protein